MSSPRPVGVAPRPADHRLAGAIGWGLAGIYLLVTVAGLGLDLLVVHRTDGALDLPWWEVPGMLSGLWLVPAPVVGAVIVSRHPRHPIGWLLLAGSLLAAVGDGPMRAAVAQGVAEPSAPAVLGAWFSAWRFGPHMMVLLLVPLLFPDGRPPSPRWRPVVWAAAVVAVGDFVSQGLLPERLAGSMWGPDGVERVVVYDIVNPFAVPALRAHTVEVALGAVGALTPIVLLAAMSAPIVRFRRANGTERRQIKWLALAAAALAVSLVVSALGLVLGVHPAITSSLWPAVLGAVPLAIGAAILRHGLYDIDRIISRTVSYGLVVAVLGGVYAVGVVGLGTAVSAVTGEEDSDLVVAGSVLAVVALFRPVRTRVQSRVDRRFNRTGYQARQAVDRFADRLRDEVDLEAIRHGLVATAAATVQPTRISIWLAPEQKRAEEP